MDEQQLQLLVGKRETMAADFTRSDAIFREVGQLLDLRRGFHSMEDPQGRRTVSIVLRNAEIDLDVTDAAMAGGIPSVAHVVDYAVERRLAMLRIALEQVKVALSDYWSVVAGLAPAERNGAAKQTTPVRNLSAAGHPEHDVEA